jgi:hypothetical protein
MEKAPAQREREVAAIALRIWLADRVRMAAAGRPRVRSAKRDRSQQIEMTTDFRFERIHADCC